MKNIIMGNEPIKNIFLWMMFLAWVHAVPQKKVAKIQCNTVIISTSTERAHCCAPSSVNGRSLLLRENWGRIRLFKQVWKWAQFTHDGECTVNIYMPTTIYFPGPCHQSLIASAPPYSSPLYNQWQSKESVKTGSTVRIAPLLHVLQSATLTWQAGL